MKINADLNDEIGEEAKLKMASYQAKVAKHYNRKVKNRPLKVKDLVLRNSAATSVAQNCDRSM